MVWILTFASCASCLQPPGDVAADSADTPRRLGDSGDSGGGGDTADTEGSDTGPLVVPRCTMELVEDDDPTNDYSQELVDVPLSTYVCGLADRPMDLDYLTFTTTRAGWVKVDVQAQSRGSSADMYDQLALPAEDEGVGMNERFHSADPLNVFYARMPGTYIAALTDLTGGSGDANGWWFIASASKEPVPNYGLPTDIANVDMDETLVDDREHPFEAKPGVHYFGTFGAPGDGDWYVIKDVPPDAVITYETDAFEFGSAADPMFRFEWGGTNHQWIYDDHWDDRNEGEDAWGEMVISTVTALSEGVLADDTGHELYPGTTDYTTVYLRLSNQDELHGSMFHWYVFWYTLSTQEK